ncbi:hypothetical protein Tco_0542146 [Tanacetum coccineum]
MLAAERAANINTQSTQYSVVHQPPQETSLEFLQDNRNLINSVQTFLGKFKRFSFYETPKVVSLAWETIFEIEHAFEDKQYQPEGILELFRKLHDDVQNIHEELAEYINTPSWNRPTIYCDDDDDDDDDEDYTIAITPDLPITDSLIMEDEHLDTIPATESDELIKNVPNDVIKLMMFPYSLEGAAKTWSDFYHEEFTDELAHIISPPEYDCFYFKSESDPASYKGMASIVRIIIRGRKKFDASCRLTTDVAAFKKVEDFNCIMAMLMLCSKQKPKRFLKHKGPGVRSCLCEVSKASGHFVAWLDVPIRKSLHGEVISPSTLYSRVESEA